MCSAREDLRKPLSRQQAHALHTRIEDLERLLRDNGIDPSHAAGPSHHSGEDEEDGEGRQAGADVSDHIVVASGGYQVHGPTSAFRHLAKFHSDEPEPTPNDDGDSLGFRRHLPAGIPISAHDHDLALKRFFRYYASWAQRTHPLRFYEDMETALGPNPPTTRVNYYSPMLHLAILAIGLCFCDDPNLRSPAVRKIFAEEAKTHFDHECMSPTIATVQALAHLASYHSLAAEHNLGWIYIGSALRCAMSMGLNLNVRSDQSRERNSTWHTVFCQEAVWAPYVGRAVLWPESTVPPPSIDEELDAWIDDDDDQPSMISSTFQQTVSLMTLGNRIMDNLYGIKSDLASLVRSGTVSEISLALTTWLEQLPPALAITSHTRNARPHILMMHLSWAWLVILLHRPFYRPLAGKSTTESSASSTSTTSSTNGSTAQGSSASAPGYHAALAVKHCDRAANQIVSLLQIWHRQHDLRYVPPTALQCCFIAGTTHLLAYASSRSEKRQAEALGRAQQCIQLLSYMAVSWPAALQKQKLLEDLLAEYGRASGRSQAQTPGVGVNTGGSAVRSRSQQAFGLDGVPHPAGSPHVRERVQPVMATASSASAAAAAAAGIAPSQFNIHSQPNLRYFPQTNPYPPPPPAAEIGTSLDSSTFDLSSLAMFSVDSLGQATTLPPHLPSTTTSSTTNSLAATSGHPLHSPHGLAYDYDPSHFESYVSQQQSQQHPSTTAAAIGQQPHLAPMQLQSLSPNSQALFEYILQPYLGGSLADLGGSYGQQMG